MKITSKNTPKNFHLKKRGELGKKHKVIE